MKLIALLVRAFPLRFVLSVVLGMLAGFSSAWLIATVHWGLQDPGSTRLLLFFAVAAIANVAAGVLAHAHLLILTHKLLGELRIRLTRAVLAAPYAKLESLGQAYVLSALTEDIQAIGNAGNALIGITIGSATIVGALGYIASLSPLVCVTVVVPLAAGAWAHGFLIRTGIQIVGKAMQIREHLMRSLTSSVAGIKELKLHQPRRTAFFAEGVTPSTRAMHRTLHQSYRLFTWATSVQLLIFFMVIGGVMFVWPRVSPDASSKVSAVALVVLFLPASVGAILMQTPTVLLASEAVTRLEGLGLSLAEGMPEPGDNPALPGPWRLLELRGVMYTHRGGDDREFTLGPLDLVLRPGEVVYVAGGNGSGKTTLAKLLIGLYQPERGDIRLDDRVMTNSDLAAYRAHFATVLADYHLFDRLYGVEGGSADAKAGELLRMMKLDSLVKVRDGAFSTIDLSQGQRKRLALVVAILQDRPIFVLDEWAAEQDPTFKEEFYTRLLPELRAAGKTVVVISHDDRYFHLGDRGIWLDDGKLHAFEAAPARERRVPPPVLA